MPRTIRTAGYVLLVAGGLFTLTYSFQSSFIFFPGKLSEDFVFRQHAEEVFISTPDGERINGLFFRGTREEVVLFFHGNAGDLSNWQFIADDFTSLGLNVFLIDYRGYGKSSGAITERGLYQDGEAAYHYLLNEKQFKADQILIYGRSIGSGIAVDLASHSPAGGLILEAPFSGLIRLATQKVPWLIPALWLKFRFDNMEKIARVKCPVLFIHGSSDTLIPPSHSQTLFDVYPGKKRMIRIESGSHNDLNRFDAYHNGLQHALDDFFR